VTAETGVGPVLRAEDPQGGDDARSGRLRRDDRVELAAGDGQIGVDVLAGVLLDEPLSALDNAMREKLQDYLVKVHAEFDMTTILVSHDVAEIYKLASKVFVLEGGKIAQEGSPGEIFLRHSGSQKFSLPAKILEISKRDAIYVAVVSVGQQLCEVALSATEAANLKSGDEASISAKAFGLNLRKNGSENDEFDERNDQIYAQSEPR